MRIEDAPINVDEDYGEHLDEIGGFFLFYFLVLLIVGFDPLENTIDDNWEETVPFTSYAAVGDNPDDSRPVTRARARELVRSQDASRINEDVNRNVVRGRPKKKQNHII